LALAPEALSSIRLLCENIAQIVLLRNRVFDLLQRSLYVRFWLHNRSGRNLGVPIQICDYFLRFDPGSLAGLAWDLAI
jgi:hypothetical protein